MPVNFISGAQLRRYGGFSGEPTPEQLSRFFHLDDRDRELIEQMREQHNRLGFALQLTTVRFLGTFLAQPIDVPAGVVAVVAGHLGIRRVRGLERYAQGRTKRTHAKLIMEHYGYRELERPGDWFRVQRWLFRRAWLADEKPSVLYDLATARLIEQKVLLPGPSVLARCVAKVRERTARRAYRRLAGRVPAEKAASLQALLEVPEGRRICDFDRLRQGLRRVSGPALVSQLHRLERFRSFGVQGVDLSCVPPNRLHTLARYAFKTYASTIARMAEHRRVATLAAFAGIGTPRALDDALDVLDALISDILTKAKRRGLKQRLSTIKDLDAAALSLREACLPLLDRSIGDERVRSEAFSRVAAERLQAAVEAVEALTRPQDDRFFPELVAQYGRVRRFLPALLRTIRFEGTAEGAAVLQALAFLRAIEGRSRPDMSAAPRAVVRAPWRRLVFVDETHIDRRAYTLCVLEGLQEALRRRDVFVVGSERWGDPRLKLIDPAHWPKLRPGLCAALGREESGRDELNRLADYLSEAYKHTVAHLPVNDAVRVVKRDGRSRLVLTALDRLPEPDTLIALKQAVGKTLPRVDLPEAMLEIEAHTSFSQAFTHVCDKQARVEDFPTSLCAVLMAEACNITLEPIVHSDIPALTRGRLNWVRQSYLRNETIARANTYLVNQQAQLPLARRWGGGEVASVDGLRFRVPDRAVHAGPNPKYFGLGRGVTFLNFVSDQYSGFHNIVVPGTLRDSLFILEGLLEQESDLDPRELMTDTAGASAIVFGLFWMLGYQFSPRLADIGGARFWRIDPQADYGPLNGVSRHRINLDRILNHWDDMLRIAASLKLGRIRASELMRSLFRGRRPSGIARAFAELGRIASTIHHLTYIDDESYRRRTLALLNNGESRHSLSRRVFHGKQGELGACYREGQEEQLGVLGLVVNILVLWNTLYTQTALDHLQAHGFDPRSGDIARLSPLGHENFNPTLTVARYTTSSSL